ncbi:MAG TPA: hypothetical protein VJS91_04575 [Nitrososphaeraceae archaeon]|jgi:hypothetical protein|nr:hypothetical protein [Nitrososphaeraceae archaeon]
MEGRHLIEFHLTYGIPDALCYWFDIIEKTANELCAQKSKEIQFKINTNRDVSIDIADYDALDCLIQSFKKHENSIPLITKQLIHHTIHVGIVKSSRRFES